MNLLPRCVGIDLSLVGTGCVEMTPEGTVGRILFFTNKKSGVERWKGDPQVQAVMSTAVTQGDELAGFERGVSVAEQVLDFVDRCGAHHVALEDHAFSAQGQSIYQLGHMHGLVRFGLVAGGLRYGTNRVPVRLYDVGSIKKFATGAGNATKVQMIIAASKEHFPADEYGEPADGNLADAYWIARMLQAEMGLRTGLLDPKLLLAREREILQRKGKHDGGFLERPFLHLPETR